VFSGDFQRSSRFGPIGVFVFAALAAVNPQRPRRARDRPPQSGAGRLALRPLARRAPARRL